MKSHGLVDANLVNKSINLHQTGLTIAESESCQLGAAEKAPAAIVR
jgi:hypothetical protein